MWSFKQDSKVCLPFLAFVHRETKKVRITFATSLECNPNFFKDIFTDNDT